MFHLSRFLPNRPCVRAVFLSGWVLGGVIVAVPAQAADMAFKQAVAAAAAEDSDIAAFYRDLDYDPIWTGPEAEDRARRAALVRVLSGTRYHGLPSERYDLESVLDQLAKVELTRDLGRMEVELSRLFLRYARDVQTGLLVPAKIDSGIVREVPYRSRLRYLVDLSRSAPDAYMAALAPASREYRALIKQKMTLEHLVANGGWGPTVRAGALKPGHSGDGVVALRDRLVRMGYMMPSPARSYDASLEAVVRRFQSDHGLEPDGVAGDSTISEVNRSAQERLKSVIVAMERERWTNMDRGDRHVLVNQTDFSARIIDHGAVTFETRTVVGMNTADRRSPEFSDEMEHMIINPSWYVPRSIVTKEYLPQLRQTRTRPAISKSPTAVAGGSIAPASISTSSAHAVFRSQCASRRANATRWGW